MITFFMEKRKKDLPMISDLNINFYITYNHAF